MVQRISRELETLARDGKARRAGEMDASADAAMGGTMREAFDWLRRCAAAVALFRVTCRPYRVKSRSNPRGCGCCWTNGAVFIRAGGVVYFAAMAEQEQLSAINGAKQSGKGVFAAVASMVAQLRFCMHR